MRFAQRQVANIPELSLQGKTALVTGAARGLGFEIASMLARCEARVIVCGRTEDALQRAVDAIDEHSPGTASALSFDVADEDAVADAFARIANDFGGLNILVNNVGMRDRRSLFEFSLQDVRQLMEVNLIAPFNLSRKAAEQMIGKGEGGRILNITSIAGPLAASGDSVYTTAKGGLEAMTRALAAELGEHRISVNGIAPGFFATETNQKMVDNPAIAQWLKDRSSAGRWGQPSEIAGAALFFVSPAASYVTGQVLAVDGGYTAHF